MTGSGVVETALNYMQCTSASWTVLYFVATFVIMNFILLNVLAFILDSVEHIRDNATWGTVRSC